MSSCILTIIKNEHPYLDEWITYHLNMGVSHIFILEDIGSDSHQDITQKHLNQVTLLPVSVILSESEQQLLTNNRAKGIPGGQQTCIKAGLDFIKAHFNYDWCFVIDNDEFLTLTERRPLDDILSDYSSYDAFILSWQCYGANGFIAKPNYADQGVVDVFTEPMNGYVPAASLEHNKKTCYNLHTFRRSFWKTIHTPTDECNFCNTAYKKDRNAVCHDVIYLRHYITKSWEEYYWKKRVRGYFYGIVRTPDAFFKMNPDMLPLKNALTASETLVILPYSQQGSQGSEIRLALTGWKRFCQFRYRFVVIGDFDPRLIDEFPWVTFIPLERAPRLPGQYNPHIDMQRKMEKAYDLFHNRYDGFIWMVDDNYATKPFSLWDIIQTHYRSLSFTGKESAPTWFWKHDKWKTRQLLDAEGLSHINYTTHFPCYFSFERLKKIWDHYDMRTNSYVVEDLYFNTYHDSRPLPAEEIRYGVWEPARMDGRLDAAIADPAIKFLVNSVEGWSPELEARVASLVFGPENESIDK